MGAVLAAAWWAGTCRAGAAGSSASDTLRTPIPAVRLAPGDTMYVVAPIEVRVERVDPRFEAQMRTPGFVTRVDLRARRDRAETLVDVLSRLAGVHVRDYGGLGAFATASIRGASPGQVAVYLDGVPVADPYTGIVNLSDLPLGVAERVDVHRGFSPASLGASAIGGVIHLVTDAGTLPPGVRARAIASYGSLDTAREQLTLRVRPSGSSRWRLLAHAQAEHTRGDFAFHDDNGTPFNAADDDPSAVRVNNDRRAWHAFGRVDVDVMRRIGARLAVQVDHFDRRQGVPGLGSNPSTTARSARSRTIAQASLRALPWGARVETNVRLYATRIGDRFRDRDGDIALGGADTDNRIDMRGGRAFARADVVEGRLRLDAVFDWRRETFHPHDLAPFEREGPDTWRHWNTTAVSARAWGPWRRLVVDGTWRVERLVEESFARAPFPWLPPQPGGRVRSTHDSPSIAARVHVAPGVAVKAAAGRYVRPPTFLERFGNAGSVTGNPDLRPERGTDRSVGVVAGLDRLGPVHAVYAEAVWLDDRADDLILFFPNSQYTSKPVNIGSARIRGWETALRARVGHAWSVSAAWTRLWTEDTSAIPYYRGNELPARPPHEVSAGLTWRRRAWRVTVEGRWIAANWLDRANRLRAPARTIVDVALRMPLPLEGLGLTLEGRNVTNDRVSDVQGFPLPGRLVFATLTWGIH